MYLVSRCQNYVEPARLLFHLGAFNLMAPRCLRRFVFVYIIHTYSAVAANIYIYTYSCCCNNCLFCEMIWFVEFIAVGMNDFLVMIVGETMMP